MRGEYNKSPGPKIVLTALYALGACAAGWISFGDGFGDLLRCTGKAAATDHILARARGRFAQLRILLLAFLYKEETARILHRGCG